MKTAVIITVAILPLLAQEEIVSGDVFRPESLPAAMQGVNAVYYLVHSLGGGSVFRELDLLAARNRAGAATSSHLQPSSGTSLSTTRIRSR